MLVKCKEDKLRLKVPTFRIGEPTNFMAIC